MDVSYYVSEKDVHEWNGRCWCDGHILMRTLQEHFGIKWTTRDILDRKNDVQSIMQLKLERLSEEQQVLVDLDSSNFSSFRVQEHQGLLDDESEIVEALRQKYHMGDAVARILNCDTTLVDVVKIQIAAQTIEKYRKLRKYIRYLGERAEVKLTPEQLEERMLTFANKHTVLDYLVDVFPSMSTHMDDQTQSNLAYEIMETYRRSKSAKIRRDTVDVNGKLPKDVIDSVSDRDVECLYHPTHLIVYSFHRYRSLINQWAEDVALMQEVSDAKQTT